MTTHEILTSARDALANDAELAAWCVAQFGRPPVVMLGLDDKNPPTEDQYPLVVILGVDQSRGDSRREVEWRLHLGTGVVNPAVTESGASRTYTGLLQAEMLREKAEDALYRAKLINIESTGESASESYYPLFVSYSMVAVTMLKSTRRSLP